MAICGWCELEMTDKNVVTCPGNTIVQYPDGLELSAILYIDPDLHRCHNCNIQSAGYHHPGCDMERCPRCQGQLISCGCLDEDEDEEA